MDKKSFKDTKIVRVIGSIISGVMVTIIQYENGTVKVSVKVMDNNVTFILA